MSVSYHTRYSSRRVEEDLKESLATSAISRDKLFDEIGILKQKQLKLMVAIQAAQAYLKIQPPDETIGQAIIAALAREADNIASDTGAYSLSNCTVINQFVYKGICFISLFFERGSYIFNLVCRLVNTGQYQNKLD